MGVHCDVEELQCALARKAGGCSTPSVAALLALLALRALLALLTTEEVEDRCTASALGAVSTI